MIFVRYKKPMRYSQTQRSVNVMTEGWKSQMNESWISSNLSLEIGGDGVRKEQQRESICLLHSLKSIKGLQYATESSVKSSLLCYVRVQIVKERVMCT